MKFTNYIILLTIFSILGCGNSKINRKLSLLQMSPIILKENGNDLFQYWEIREHKYLKEYELGEVNALQAYRDSISEIIGDSVIQNMIKRERIQSQISNENVDSLNNYDLIHKGYLGEIRRINFIEAELLNYQITRYPLFSHPTEFHSFIMKNDSLGLIRIYFGANDQPWPPKPKSIIAHIEHSINNGWYLTSHLHNHYEPASNNYVGVMAPSLADVHYFKILKNRFGLSEALITNGFSTLILKEKNFDKLNSH